MLFLEFIRVWSLVESFGRRRRAMLGRVREGEREGGEQLV
jgi:hypothetical protein